MVQYRPFLKHGAYSAIVYIDDTYYFAEDYEGDRITEGTNAATVIQAAIDIGGKVILSKGQYDINVALNAVANLNLEGQGQDTILNLTTVDQNGMMIDDKNNVNLRNFKIDSSVTKTAGAAIKSAGTNKYGSIEDIFIDNQHHGIDLIDWTIVHLHRIDIRDTIHTVIEVDGGNDQFLTEIVADKPTGAQSTYGIHIKDTGAIWVNDCDILHSGYGLYIDPATGHLVEWGFFKGLILDNCSDWGMHFTEANGGTIKGLTFTNCWASSNTTGGVAINSGIGIRFIGLKCLQNAGFGVLFNGGTDNVLQDSDVWDNDTGNSGKHGMTIAAGVTDFTITGNRIGNVESLGHQRYGIIVNVGASDNYIIQSNNCGNNETGGVSDAGTGVNKVVADNL